MVFMSNIFHYRDHYFDLPERNRTKSQRKPQTISSIDEAPRGARGVREHFKVDETKILTERRIFDIQADGDNEPE